MRMRAPQAHTRGSASKIFLIKRAQVLRASLEKSELSWASAAGAPGLSACSRAQTILPRLEYAPWKRWQWLPGSGMWAVMF